MPLTTFQILMTLKLLLNLRANLITINELADLDFSTRVLNVKPKELTLGIKLLQNLASGTKILQKLPNGKKILQIYFYDTKGCHLLEPLLQDTLLTTFSYENECTTVFSML